MELLAHLCGSAAAGLRPAVRSVQKLELKEPSAQQREGVSKKRERCTMRLVAAHRTPLAESDGRAPSSSETRLRGNFFMLRDPVCPRGVRPFLVLLQCELSLMGAAALAARLGPLRRCSSP